MSERDRPPCRIDYGLFGLTRFNRLEFTTESGELGANSKVVLQPWKVCHLKTGKVVVVVEALARLEKTIARIRRLAPDTPLVLKVAKVPQGMQYPGRPGVEVHHERTWLVGGIAMIFVACSRP